MRRLQREEGWALVTAMILMGLMMGVALSGYAYVDAQQRHSGTQRVRESAFNLGEGVLSAESFLVASKWPGQGQQFPRECRSSDNPAKALCPDPALMKQSYTGGDYSGATSWKVAVRDNGGDLPSTPTVVEQNSLSYYHDELDGTGTDAQPSWDANNDLRVWVRASATVGGKTRTMVGLVTADEVVERFPRNAVTAGAFMSGNNGNKIIVDTQGESAESSPVAVRCVGTSGCLEYRDGQLVPENVMTGLADGGRALSDAALNRLRQRAIANNTYYASCPIPNPSGPLVFVESGDCSFNNSVVGPCCNTPENPGVFVVASGTITFSGSLSFYGVLYAANRQGSSGDVVVLQGTTTIYGSIVVDGAGRLTAGSSGGGGGGSTQDPNLVYDDDVFGAIKSYPTGNIVPGSWREIEGTKP